MVYKKYIKRNGKLYGPYYYESFRDEHGAVINRYVSKEDDRVAANLSSGLPYRSILIVLGAIVLVAIALVFLLSNHPATSQVSLSLEPSYSPGEMLQGSIRFGLSPAEFVPADSVVVLQLGEMSEEMALSALVEESPSEGDFFAEGVGISGSGRGYAGSDIPFLDIDISKLNISAEQGALSVKLVYGGIEIASASAEVMVEDSEKKEKIVLEEQKETVFNIKNQAGDNIESEVELTDNENGKKNIKVKMQKGAVKEISFRDVGGTDNLARVDDIPETAEFSSYREIYAIDPTGMNFSDAVVTVNAKGSELWKCREWDFDARECNGEWEKIMNIAPGQDYSFVLTNDDPAFVETSEAPDVSVAPLDKTTFIVGWVDKTSSNISFKVMDVNKTLIYGPFSIGSGFSNVSRVEVSMIDATKVVIAYINNTPADGVASFVIYNLSGSKLFGPTVMNTNGGQFNDISITQLGTKFAVCYVEAKNSQKDTHFQMFYNNGTQAVAESDIHTSMGPTAPLQNYVSCAATNSSRWASYTYTGSPSNVEFKIFDDLGNLLVTNLVDPDAGTAGEATLAPIDSDKFAMVWYSSDNGVPANVVQMAIFNVNGSQILAPTTIDSNMGTESRVAITPVKPSEIEVLDWFVVSWWNKNQSALKAAVYTGNGSVIKAPFNMSTDQDETYRLMDLAGKERSSSTSFFLGKFMVAYTNSSNQGVYLGFDVSGVTWNGTTIPDVYLNYPQNNYYNDSASPLNVLFNCSGADARHLKNMSLYLTNSANQAFALSQTNAVSGTFNTTTFTSSLVNGNYTWNCQACSLEGICAFAAANRTLTVNYAALDIIAPSIVFNSQTPADLTSNNILGGMGLNITYNITDNIALNLNKIILYYKNNETGNNVDYYLNGTAVSGFRAINYTSSLSSIFLFRLFDNQVYPATYNFNERAMETTVHSSGIDGNSNDYASIEIYNVSVSAYSFLEVMANRSVGMGGLRIYYCNSSYAFGSRVATSPLCTLFYTVVNNSYNHIHSAYSAHMIVPFAANTTTGLIGNVKVTPVSYFMLRGITGSTWNYYYITDTARADAVRTSGNGGNSWTSQTYTIDAHLHQYDGTDRLWYYACANDTSNNQNCSSLRYDLIDLAGLPPSAPNVYNPMSTVYGGYVDINYTAALSPNGYAISFYNISLVNIDLSFNKTIVSNNSVNLGYLWDSTGTPDGNYIIMVQACDNMSQCSYGESENFSLDNTAPYVKIEYPANNSLDGDGNVNFSCSANDTVGLKNLSLVINGAINQTASILGFSNSSNFTLLGIADGAYLWHCSACDTSGGCRNSTTMILNVSRPAVPIYSNFTNSGSTNWSALSDLRNVCNGTAILNTSLDSVQWAGCVNADGANFDANVVLANNFVGIVFGLHSSFNSSAQITMKNLSWDAIPDILIDGQFCGNETCQNVFYDNVSRVVIFNVTHFTNYTTIGNARLSIWDSNDTNMPGGNERACYLDNTTFYANYTRSLNGNPLSGATCVINFADSSGNTMTYNSTSTYYEYSRTFSSNGTRAYNVTCAKSGSQTITLIDYVNISDCVSPKIDFASLSDVSGSLLVRRNIVVNVTAEDINLKNITIYLYNSTGLVNASTGSSSPYYLNFTNLGDGTYWFNATAYDLFGNYNATGTRNATIDSTSPYAVSITPLNGTVTNVTSQNFTANFSDNQGLRNATLNIYNQTGDLYNQTTVDLGGALQATASVFVNLVNGIYSWFWQVFDLANNAFNTQTTEGNRTITVDTINPYIRIDSPLNSTYRNATILVNITSTGIYTQYYNGTAWNVYSAPIYLTFAEGTTTINARTNDSAGNANSTSVQFFVDSIAPHVVINSPLNITYGNANISIDITATDANLGSVWFNNGTANVSYTAPVYLSFTNGSHTIIAYANDTLGNVNWTSITFGVETNLPSIVVHSPQPVYYNNGTVLVNVTSNGVSTWFWNGTANVSYTAPVYLSYPDGNHTVIVYSNNSAGLVNSYSVTFYIDTIAPFVSIVSPLNITYNDTNSILVAISSTGNYTWFNDGTANYTYVGSAFFSFPDGSNRVYAWANDSAGNLNWTYVQFFVDSCIPNMTNTSWSEWTNLSCVLSQMNQSRYKIEYDTKSCGEKPNVTYYEYRFAGPDYYNTTWTDWYNISMCFANNTLVQARNLTQYDAYSCALNTTFFEYNVSACNYDGAPKIYIISPLNATYNNRTQLVNISVSDSAVSSVWFWNGTANVSYTGPVYLTFAEGSSIIYAWANDSAGNVNSTAVQFNIDSTSPYAVSITPLNGTVTNVTSQNFTANFSDNQGLRNATLNIYNQTGDLYNQTTVELGGALQATASVFVNLVNGIYSWFWQVFDLANNAFNTQTTEGNRTINVDTLRPSLVVYSPLNQSYSYDLILISIGSTGNYTYWSYLGQNYTYYGAVFNTFQQGSNTVYTYTNDTVGNANSTSVQFFVDSIAPHVVINSPLNITYGNANISIDITATDANLGSVWFNNGTANVSYTAPVYLTFVNGSHTIIAYANDTLGNVNWTSITFGVETNLPSIVVHSPKPVYYANGTVLVNVTSNGVYTWFWNGTANVTYTGPVYATYPDGNHTIIVYSNNSAGLVNSYSVTFTVDSVKPYIRIDSPLNITYTNKTILVNLTAIGASNVWFFNGTANVSYSGAVYITFNNGSNVLYVYANDSAGNLNSSSVNFFIYLCVSNITNTTWSNWQNLSCVGNQKNQSRFRVEYDANSCGFFNLTHYEYRLVGPDYYNTTWSNWTNISCSYGNTMNQTRNLTQYDAYSCAANTTFFEFRSTETCDFCMPNMTNTTFGNWKNVSSCLANNTVEQSRNKTEYDLNNCGETGNTTFFEYNVSACNYDGSPKIYIISPLNATYNNRTQLVNISVSDSAVSSVWFWNGTANVSYTGPVYLTFAEGSSIIYAWANDSAGNVNRTAVQFNINTSISDPIPPVILTTDIEPYDPYIGGEVMLSMNASDNLVLSGRFANITLPNGAVVIIPLNASYLITMAGRHNVTFWANDSAGNIATFEDYFIAGNAPINVTFNAVNHLLNGIPVNLTLYFAGTDKEIHLHNFTGIKLDSHTDIFYDLLFNSLVDDISVKMFNVNLSRYNNHTLGLDKDTSAIGRLVVYGINSSYNFSSAILRISYAGTAYSDESALILEKCDDWIFENRTCLGNWSDITSQSSKNTASDYFEVNTTSFSGFSIREPAAAPPASSGGGTSTRTTLADIETSTDLIEVTLLQGEKKTAGFNLINRDTRNFDITIDFEKLDGLVLDSGTQFLLYSKESREVNIEFYASSEQKPGVYAGRIIIDSESGKRIVNVILTVKERRPLLDLALKVSSDSEKVYNGDSVEYSIDLRNIGLPAEVNVSLEQWVADLDKDIVFRMPTDVFMLDKNRSLRKIIREFSAPMNLKEGRYIVIARANYQGASAEAYDVFEVMAYELPMEQRCNLLGLLVSLLLVAIAILLIFIVLIRRNKKTIVKRCRAEGEVRREMADMKEDMRKAFRHFRHNLISRDEYMHRKVLYSHRTRELEKELADIRRMKSGFTEKELITLGAMKHRLNSELIKLNREYRRGTIETEGYKRTKHELEKKINDIDKRFRCLGH